MKIKAFQNLIWDYYSKNKRNYPWRDTVNPYHIWVSEIMLQQTQTDRTIPKYLEFLDAFPTISDLAVAEQAHVLRLWKGLGYNRRALYLKKAAEIVVNNYRGSLPNERKLLLSLPGIGPYTASAILTFAYKRW